MLQNKFLTFYFELKLQVREWKPFPWLRYAGYLRVVARSWFQPLLWERIRASSQPWGRWREAHDLVNERAPSGLCMCPFYCGQVIDRCSCSGSSCLIPFMTSLWLVCGKERILDNLPVKRSGLESKICIWKYFTSENH